MSEPGDWREHAGIGAFIMGALWAARELVPRMFRDQNGAQRRITPADVLEEVRKLDAELAELRSTFRLFVEEERATHVSLLAIVRDVLPGQRH